MTVGMEPLIAATAAVVTVFLLVPIAGRVARRIGAVAHPRTDRWGDRSVPLLGGIAVYAGIVIGIALLPLDGVDRVALVTGLTILFLLGLSDDLGGLPALLRLGIEAAVGAGFVWVVSEGLTPELRIAAVILGAVAIPVAVNATNLTDNADGLAATLGVATAAVLFVAANVNGLASASAGTAIVIGGSAGAFLVFNRPPARVYMGDGGSLALGFALAAVSVLVVRDALLIPGNTHVAAAMIVPVAWAFQVGDLGMVVVTRWRRGESPFKGGVDHTSHRLLAAGLTPWALLLGLGLLAGVVGSAAAAAAALIGGFALTASVAIALLLLVAVFEAGVAWRLPPTRPGPVDTPEAPPPPMAQVTRSSEIGR